MSFPLYCRRHLSFVGSIMTACLFEGSLIIKLPVFYMHGLEMVSSLVENGLIFIAPKSIRVWSCTTTSSSSSSWSVGLCILEDSPRVAAKNIV
jgi:hypothetical protein